MAEAVLATAPRPLYHSPWGLLDFQARDVARAYLGTSMLGAWDCGLGKTHLDMATAALLFEDDKIDVHLLVCEQNKVAEWTQDFRTFTDLNVVAYYGDADKRRKIIASLDSAEPIKIGRKKTDTIHRPQVLISTYETFRNDLVVSAGGKGKRKRYEPNFLARALGGRRVLIGLDEMTKVGNRGTTLHKSQEILIKHVRATGGEIRMLGLTATPMDRDPESYYNLGRLLCPADVGTVDSFNKDHVLYRDEYGNATRFKNLDPETKTEPWVTPLSVKMGRVLARKRWTDPDVIDQFPKVTEKFVPVVLGDRQQEFYEAVAEVLAQAEQETDLLDRSTLSVLRMIAGLPESLTFSQGRWAQEIVGQVGIDGLRAIGSAKLEVLVDRLKPVVTQGDQAVVFTFFGPSMIPLIAARLRDEGISVAEHYGNGLSPQDRERAREEFKQGRARVLLSSDAGARGINLPQASHAIEFEAALTHSTRTQRLKRIHRLDSREKTGRDQVWFQSLVAKDTVEDFLVKNVLTRNEWSDRLLGDADESVGEDFITAEMRLSMLRISRAHPVTLEVA